MIKIGGLLSKSISPEKLMAADARIKQVLEDEDVKEFIKLHSPVIDNAMIQRNMSRLMEYVKERDTNERLMPILSISANNIHINYVPRSKELSARIANGISSKIKYDDSTMNLRGAVLENFEIEIYNSQALAFVQNFIKNYVYDTRVPGMWLCGAFGIGKSFLMGGFVNELRKRQIGVVFIGVNQLVTDLTSMMRVDSKIYNQKIEEAKHCEILILDDIGTENLTSWSVKNVLYQILNYRFNENLSTFFTSNLTKGEYKFKLETAKDVDTLDAYRLMERIDGLAREIQMAGPNRRKKA